MYGRTAQSLKPMVKRLFKIKDKLILISLGIEIAWLRFKTRKVRMSKSNFLIYTFFILLIGLGLGMIWGANQVEPILKKQIAILEKSKSEWVPPLIRLEKTQNSYLYPYSFWENIFMDCQNLLLIELPWKPIL